VAIKDANDRFPSVLEFIFQFEAAFVPFAAIFFVIFAVKIVFLIPYILLIPLVLAWIEIFPLF
jgi:hypothetical protein